MRPFPSAISKVSRAPSPLSSPGPFFVTQASSSCYSQQSCPIPRIPNSTEETTISVGSGFDWDPFWAYSTLQHVTPEASSKGLSDTKGWMYKGQNSEKEGYSYNRPILYLAFSFQKLYVSVDYWVTNCCPIMDLLFFLYTAQFSLCKS